MVLEKSVEKVSKSLEKPPKARETSFKTPSLVGCKEDASFAGLSISKLQQGTFPLVKDFGLSSLAVDEYIFNGSFFTMDSHFTQFEDWLDLQGFLEKVYLLPSLGQFLYLPTLLSLTCCCYAAQNGLSLSF
jgi:hypothetical protein